ncbi:MAG TPA: LuxR C-terminal-related transcriptional regulator [Streptosporangiaceae bacterium]
MGAGHMGSAWPMIGRARELATIGGVMAAGHPGGFVLRGPTGIGKTRLAHEVLLAAESAGRHIEWVAATRATASIPFGAVSHLLEMDDRLTVENVGLLRHTVDRLAENPGLPMVLGVDDAHLLDDGSAALIHQLVLRGVVFLVATVRTGEAVPDAITTLWKDNLVRSLHLGPLSPVDADALLDEVLGPHIEGVTRQEIGRVTAGNPLVLRELLAGALENEALVRRQGVWCWGSGPRYGAALIELVEGRLAALDEATRSVLEFLACGEPLSAGLLERLIDSGTLDVRAVATAERRGLIAHKRSGRRECLALTHPIYGEVIRAGLSRYRARGVYQSILEAAGGLPTRRNDDVLRLAVWQLEAGVVALQPSLLIEAAYHAAARADFTLAERLLRTARDAGEPRKAARALARVLAWQGRLGEVASVLPETAPAQGGDDDPARWAVVRAWSSWGQGKAARAGRELDAAVPSTERGRLEVAATRAWLLLFAGRAKEAVEAVSGVIDRRVPDENGTVWPHAVAAAANAEALTGRTDGALALIDRGLAVARREDAAVWEPVILGWARCRALHLSGRLLDAQTVGHAGYAEAVALGLPDMVVGWIGYLGSIALTQGRVIAAQAALREALARLAEHDPYRYGGYFMAELACANALAGDAEAAREWLRRSEVGQGENNKMFAPWAELDRAWVIAAGGEPDRAAEQAGTAAELARTLGQHAVEAIALYDVARLGDPGSVRARLEELTGLVDGAFVRSMAGAATALTAADGAALDAAAAEFDGLALPLHAAELAAAAARAHRAAGRRRPANASWERSITLAGLCEGARTPLLSSEDFVSVLTAREREIATLAASGLASKAIADRLSLSRRTVENHLARAYNKLGVTSRKDVARLLTVQAGPAGRPPVVSNGAGSRRESE